MSSLMAFAALWLSPSMSLRTFYNFCMWSGLNFHFTESMVNNIGLQCEDNILSYYNPPQDAKIILTSDDLGVTEKETQESEGILEFINPNSHPMWLVVQLLLLYLSASNDGPAWDRMV